MKKLSIKKVLTVFLLFVSFFLFLPVSANAQAAPFPGEAARATMNMPTPPPPPAIPFIDLTVRTHMDEKDVSFSLQLLLLLTVLSLAPSIIILMTSFLRVSIVLDFVKRALSLQQVPPNQVILGISLFLTVFIMWPTFETINNNAIKPLSAGELSVQEAYMEAVTPLKIFMYSQMGRSRDGKLTIGEKNIELFMAMRGFENRPNDLSEIPIYILIPAFILNELTIAFRIGILLFIPFIVIDMVVASALMSMGMIMLPPVMISMPFKLILFILVDGWGLLTYQLVRSFATYGG